MPHLIIDYSDNLGSSIQELKILEALHDVMLNCGLFSPDAVKSRSYNAQDFLVGTKGNSGSFLHVSVAILSGRTVEQKQTLSQALINILQEKLIDVDSLTVEIRELDRETYKKVTAS